MAIISGIIELIGDVDSRKLPVLIFSRDFFIFSRFKNFNAKVLTNFESGINRRSVSDTFHGHFWASLCNGVYVRPCDDKPHRK